MSIVYTEQNNTENKDFEMETRDTNIDHDIDVAMSKRGDFKVENAHVIGRESCDIVGTNNGFEMRFNGQR